jgi:hypothetical protein
MGVGISVALVVLGLSHVVPSAGPEPPAKLRAPRAVERSGVPRPGRPHEHVWRLVSVSRPELAEVAQHRCATCSAVSFSGTVRSALTACVESRAFIKVRFSHDGATRAPRAWSTR